MGIQVANWNTEQAEFQQETDALVELKKELNVLIISTKARALAYQRATDAGKRSLVFIDSQKTAEKIAEIVSSILCMHHNGRI